MYRFPVEEWRKKNPLPKITEAVCQWVCDAFRFSLTHCNELNVDQIIADISDHTEGILRPDQVEEIVRLLPECIRAEQQAEQQALRDEANRETIIKNFIRQLRAEKGKRE